MTLIVTSMVEVEIWAILSCLAEGLVFDKKQFSRRQFLNTAKFQKVLENRCLLTIYMQPYLHFILQ